VARRQFTLNDKAGNPMNDIDALAQSVQNLTSAINSLKDAIRALKRQQSLIVQYLNYQSEDRENNTLSFSDWIIITRQKDNG